MSAGRVVACVAVERLPLAPYPVAEHPKARTFSAGPVSCRLKQGWTLAPVGTHGSSWEVDGVELRCGCAGCCECGGATRRRRVSVMTTVQAALFGMVRMTSKDAVVPWGAGGDGGAGVIRAWRRVVRTMTRRDRDAPFRAAVVVVEAEPQRTGATVDGCVCDDLSSAALEVAEIRWGPCAVCRGTRRSPAPHLHAHVVVAHDGPVWYGTGAVDKEAHPERADWAWADKGLLGRIDAAGVGNTEYRAIRGGPDGAGAYLDKVASYLDKVSAGEDAEARVRTPGERAWWALWQRWVVGPSARSVSSHGEAYGRGIESCGCATGVKQQPKSWKAPPVPAVPGTLGFDLPRIRAYVVAEGVTAVRGKNVFVGRGGVLVGEVAARLVFGGEGPMVPSHGQVHPAPAGPACGFVASTTNGPPAEQAPPLAGGCPLADGAAVRPATQVSPGTTYNVVRGPWVVPMGAGWWRLGVGQFSTPYHVATGASGWGAACWRLERRGKRVALRARERYRAALALLWDFDIPVDTDGAP